MSDTVLCFQNVSKQFRILRSERTLFRAANSLVRFKPMTEVFWALHDVSFDVKKGAKIAVIGRNGAGKTTLFRIAAGIYKPTGGKVIAQETVMPLFKYGLGLNVYLSVIDNIYLVGAYYGILVSEIKEKISEILSFAELEEFMYMPVMHLSSGQVQRLCFSIFIQSDSSFWVFDESTSVADMRFQKKISRYFDKVFQSDKTILMASHSLSTLRERCSHAVWLEKGEVKQFGPILEVVREYERFCNSMSVPSMP